MSESEDLIKSVLLRKCETPTLEVKAAINGSPKVYDTLSSFSNQTDGGDIVFGIDEKSGFSVTGVYDAQKLQKDLVEQCKEMQPEIRPSIEVVTYDGKTLVVAHVDGIPMGMRPVYRKTAGITRGSFVRSGDQDIHMNAAELYEIEAFKNGYRDDQSVPSLSDNSMLDPDMTEDLIHRAKGERPHLAKRPDSEVLRLLGAVRDEKPTLAGLMTLSDYPQQAYPNLCVTAIAVAGTHISQDELGNRFLDNKTIEGSIAQMIEETMLFVRRNTRTKSVIKGAVRENVPEYPESAVREIVTNALMHRDYGPYSNGTPVRVVIYSDRIECSNPGGIYGGQSIEDLGRANIQTRNPALVSLLEIQGVAENRHSGIPGIRDEMKKAGLRPPIFRDERGSFSVTLYNEPLASQNRPQSLSEEVILDFCSAPRSRQEIAERFGVTTAYVARVYLNPLVQRGLLALTIPDKPQSKNQRFYRA